MTLQVLKGGKPEDEPDRRILAPGAPPSPSVVPLELARHLEMGEALVWWNEKLHIERAPIIMAGALVAIALTLVTVLAPEFWAQPFAGMWQPLLAVCAPLIFAIVRERLSRRSVLVTDTAIVEVDLGGHAQRLGFDNVRSVRRDLLRGGLRLEGARASVRIPAMLIDDARAAIESTRRGRVRTREGLDDPTGWLP
ncbi:MAG TPA: hypothetical protein VG755_18140 [Nannocystaceae bacterium]|nr:hypothetical protein [Nannocystaceae bacterium]